MSLGKVVLKPKSQGLNQTLLENSSQPNYLLMAESFPASV